MKKLLKSIVAVMLCAVFAIGAFGAETACAAAKNPLKVAFKGKSVTLSKDVSKGDIKVSLKTMKSKWGKPKKTTEDGTTYYTWKKGKTIIKYSKGDINAIEINIGDKNGALLGVKVGMKKATMLKKLKGLVSEEDIEEKGYSYISIPGVISTISVKDGKVSNIFYQSAC